MTLWLAVTPDDLELPFLTGKSAGELADLLGMERSMVHHLMTSGGTSYKKYNNHSFKVRRVEIDL